MPKPNKDLKCFMRTAKNGAVYRTCLDKDKKPYKKHQNLRGDPKRTDRSYPRDIAYLKDIDKNPASVKRKAGKKATERGALRTKGEGSKTIYFVGVKKSELEKINKQRDATKAQKKKVLDELIAKNIEKQDKKQKKKGLPYGIKKQKFKYDEDKKKWVAVMVPKSGEQKEVISAPPEDRKK